MKLGQFGFLLNDKFGKTVHKVIFTSPTKDGKFIEICQRYYDPKDKEMKVGKNAFPVDPADWVRQSHNRFIQYKDWQTCLNYGLYQQASVEIKTEMHPKAGVITFYEMKSYVKPNGKLLSSLELGSNKVAQVAAAVVQGAQMNIGLILVIVVLAAGIMGGALLGYFGLPPITGQHLVPNPTVTPK